MLNENTQAPDFTLTDAAGAPHSLADFRGQWVVLYFYPRDNTQIGRASCRERV